jgi:hypothetical protein
MLNAMTDATAKASPRPWRVADIDHDHDILDADGKVAARAAHGNRELAALIVEAVNERVKLLNVLSEEQEHGYLMEAECDRLRGIVRRLAKVAQNALDFAEALNGIIEATPERIKAQDDARTLLREARAALEEGGRS